MPRAQTASPLDNQQPPAHEFLTPREVSDLIRKPVSSMAVDRCLRHDHPPYLKVGRKIIYKKSDVLAWMEAHRVTPVGGAGGTQ